MMPWSKEPVTRLFTVADRCRNTSRRPGFTETEHCCRPLSREHCCRPVSSEDQLGHQLAPLKWAPFCACQAEQPRSRTQSCTGALSLARQSSNAASSNAPTQSCTGAFLRLPGNAATQQNAALHGLLVAATQSCTGSLFCLPGKAATQQNAVLHGLLVLLARQSRNAASSNAAERSLARALCFACQGRQQHTWQARRSSSTTGS